MPELPQAPNDMEFIASAVRKMVSNIETGIAIEQLLEAGAGPAEYSRFPQLSRLYDKTSIPRTLNLLHQIFVKEITLCITRVLDGPGNDRASLGEVFRRLAKAETRKALINERHQTVQYFFKRDAAQWLGLLEANWNELRQGNYRAEVNRLFEARNAYVAHALLLEVDPGTYSEMFEVFRKTTELVSEFGELTGHYQNGFAASVNHRQLIALDFWDTLIAGEALMRDRLWKS